MTELEQMDLQDTAEITNELLYALIAEVRMLRYEARLAAGGKLNGTEQADYATQQRMADEIARSLAHGMAEVDREDAPMRVLS